MGRFKIGWTTATVVLSILLAGCVNLTTGTNEPPSAPAGALSTGTFEPKLSNSFDKQWSTAVSRDEMIETALYKMFEDLDEIRVPECEVRPVLFLGPPLLEEHHYLMEEIANGMVESFCDYLSKDIPVVSGSYEFLKEVMRQEGYQGDQYGGVCGFDLQQDWASACAVYGVAWTGISLGSSRQGVAFVEERRLTIAAHELFHIVHDQINPKGAPGTGDCRTYACAGPVWFYEGAGEFFGRAMTQYLELQNYATFVPTDRNGRYIDGDYLSDLDFLTASRNKASGVENYYSGQVAMEFMIANKGLLPVLAIWEKMDQGLPFPDAFEDSLGINLEDFYQAFRVLHTRLYEEAGYCESGLGCEEWEKSTQRPEDWYQDNGQNSGDIDQNSPQGEESSNTDGRILNSECIELNELWWSKCTELEYEIPATAENSDHGYPLDYNQIAKIDSCEEMTLIGFDIDGWAKSFDARQAAGASRAHVSTQYYAAIRYLDVNGDGLVCNSQAPE